MPIAVIARLDDETAETTVETFADGLSVRYDARPPLHITLATYRDDADLQAVDAAVRQVIRSWTPLSVTLVGFGVFPGQPSDVWFAPVPIHKLLELHTAVDAAVFEVTARHCHEFGIWMPTVNVGQAIHDSDSVEALVRLYDGPIDVVLDRIETNPYDAVRDHQQSNADGITSSPATPSAV